MGKFLTLLLLIFMATLVAKAQFPQTLPITHTSFFAASAIHTDGVTLEKGAYTGTDQTTIPILANQWNLSGKTTNSEGGGVSPVVTSENFLFYSNYVDNAVGKKVVVPGTLVSPNLRTSVFSLTNGDLYTDAAFYLSVLVKFSAAPASANDFLCFESNFTGNSQRGRVYVKSVTDGIQIGLGWGSSPGTYSSTIGLNQTHLLVVKMIPTLLGATETCVLWVNPVIGATEEASTAVETKVETAALKRIRGIVVRQRPEIAMEYSGFRFSNNWADVVKAVGPNSVLDVSQGNSSFNIYPNPASDNMNFEYTLLQNADIQLDMYNISNQLVKTLISSKNQAAGNYSKSNDVSGLKPGIYFAKFTSGKITKSFKVAINR